MRLDVLVALCLLAALAVLGLALATARADAVLSRRRAAAAELARRQWARTLADASFDGLLIHRQGVILQMNRALVRMLGVREREWLGQHFGTVARPDQIPALRAELEAPHSQVAEFRLLRANKTEIAVELSSQTTEFEGAPATVTAIRDITQRLTDAQRIARLTHYDLLTGLANRKLFFDMLATALARHDRKSGTSSVFTLDLDRFKAFNQSLGRETGDRLLKQVAARITSLVAREDLLARLGGDKFALLINCPPGADRAKSLGGQLAASFNEPFVIDGQMVKITASIGIATYPDHASDADGLMRASDFALAQASREGGGAAHIFCHTEAEAASRASPRELAPPRREAPVKTAIRA